MYTYRLATGIPEDKKDFVTDKNQKWSYEDLFNGFKEVQKYSGESKDGVEVKHELYCAKDGGSYSLFYRVTFIPDWDKVVFWSDYYPSRLRGQTPKDGRAGIVGTWQD